MAPEEILQNGIIRRYIINITRIDTGEMESYTSQDFSIILQVLPFRRYLVSIAAVTVDTGPFSEYLTVEMPEDGKCEMRYKNCYEK